MATRNKLSFLKEAMKNLLQNVQKDEEIVIIDGASQDGSSEYLNQLLNENKIQQLISEPDKGEAHALNKGLLVSRGELIKIISDDDVFYYHGINECKKFMLSHPEIDVLGTEGGGTNLSLNTPVGYTQYFKNYESWLNSKRPFSFCGLGLMLRRKALPLLGLFNTNVVSVDAEYTLRLTSINCQFTWYTGYCWARISNTYSNSNTQSYKIFVDLKKLEEFYLEKRYNKTYFALKKMEMKFKRRIKDILKMNMNSGKQQLVEESIMNKFRQCLSSFEEKNLRTKADFISNV